MKTIKEILRVYKSGFKSAKKLKFLSVERQDVYNITAPFKFGRSTYILGRVEPRNIEEGARVIFFKKSNSSWKPDNTCQIFILEDPFITKIQGMYIFGGVEVKPNPRIKGFLTYRVVFYKGGDIHNLKQFAVGPWGMKGIRLVELPNEKIGVFTRPQGSKGRRGRIGFTIIDSLQKLTPRVLTNAEVLTGQFARGEWGGVNDVLVLKNGKLGVLGHVARYSSHKDIAKRMRFYYPVVFCFEPETRAISTLRLLVRRAELPEGEAKRPDLYNVVYPGGIKRIDNGLAKLYAGVGDAEAYEVLINDPFDFYEMNGV